MTLGPTCGSTNEKLFSYYKMDDQRRNGACESQMKWRVILYFLSCRISSYLV